MNYAVPAPLAAGLSWPSATVYTAGATLLDHSLAHHIIFILIKQMPDLSYILLPALSCTQLDNDLQQFSGELQLACDFVTSTNTSTQHEGDAADSKSSSSESQEQLGR